MHTGSAAKTRVKRDLHVGFQVALESAEEDLALGRLEAVHERGQRPKEEHMISTFQIPLVPCWHLGSPQSGKIVGKNVADFCKEIHIYYYTCRKTIFGNCNTIICRKLGVSHVLRISARLYTMKFR